MAKKLVSCLIFGSLILYACGESSDEEWKKIEEYYIDKQLKISSPVAAYTEMDMKMEAYSACIFYDSEDFPELAKECNTFKDVLSVTKPIYRHIKEDGELVNDLYWFNYLKIDDISYTESEIGYFDSKNVCEEFAAQFRDAGIATFSCKTFAQEKADEQAYFKELE